MSTRQDAQLAVTDETRQEGSRVMTIQTNIRELIGSIEKMKALAAGLLAAAMMAASLLAPAPAHASAFPGANGKIVFSSNRSTGTGVNNPENDPEIFSMNPDGTALKQLTKNKAGQDIDPTYSSDGKKIAFRSDRTGDSEIFVMNSDGTGQKNLTNNPGNDLRPSFASDGKKIAFQSTRTGNSEIFVMNSDGTGQTDLTNDPASDVNATFSPKGDKIAFVSVRSGLDAEIFVMNSNGTGQTPLTANDALEDDPSFSPDGNKIAFSSNRDGGTNAEDFDIFVMNADGTGTPLRPTSSTARDEDPAFSPDGKKIAFKSSRDGSEDVFVMDASGANQTNITPGAIGVFDREPDWQPVGATFTVTSDADPGDGVCNATSCTLREAIDASNNLQAQVQNKIKFNISGGGVHTITPPTTPLPQITSPVVIDGYTQPTSSPNTLTTGTNAVLKVELNGTNLPGSVGLNIFDSSNSVIRGLAINRFAGGIVISGTNQTQVKADNRIEGNFIGTDPTGTLAQGNDSFGVGLDNADGNVIGGTTPAARNLISANADGIEFNGNSSGNAVLGNLIGTTPSGTGALGNSLYGVAFFGTDVPNNRIGDGTSAGANTVAFSGKDGIELDGSGSQTGNAISRNSIFSNAGLGIDLFGGFENAQGTTANDPGDIDTGSNNLQNFPVLASAKTSSTTTTISATLNSTPTKTFKVQFYSNPSGNEGKKFIGQKSVTTNGSGNGSFSFSPSSKVAVGQTVTATATDPAGNTSEFSAARKVASS